MVKDFIKAVRNREKSILVNTLGCSLDEALSIDLNIPRVDRGDIEVNTISGGVALYKFNSDFKSYFLRTIMDNNEVNYAIYEYHDSDSDFYLPYAKAM